MSMLNKVVKNEVTADILQYKQLIAGRPKAGKTSLFHGIVKEKFDGDMSKGLLVAFEKGYSALDGIHAVDIEEWEDFQDLVEELVDNKDEVSYEVLGFDTIDILIKLATQYVVAKQSIADKKRYTAINDIGWGKGYALMEEEIAEQVGKLDQAGYGLFFITHDKDTTMTTREGLEYNKTIISAGGRGGDYFRNTADLIVFIELTKEIEKGKQVDKRYIYFRGDADMEAGSRFKYAPTRVEYSTENYINAIEDAIKKEYGSDEAVEEAKEKQAEEAVKKEEEKKKEESVTPEDLIAKIDKQLKDVSKDDKVRLAELLKADFGNANYKKYDDVDDLKKALKLVGKL